MSRTLMPCLLVLLLAGCESAMSGVNKTARDMGSFTKRLTDAFTGNTPRSAAAQMEDLYFPDERREGINTLVDRDFGKREPYTQRYAQIAEFDSDWLVRATAIRALNRSRDASAVPLLIKSLGDKNDLVRLEAAKALVNIPDASASPALVRIVTDINENRDVRIAGADALRHYRSLEVARALVNTLSGREYGLAWQAHKSLQTITGQDLQYDEAAWLAYLTGPEKPFG